jgi:CRISPR system Cascade subunit CasE
MYLSRLVLDVRSGAVRRWLSDVDQLHRDVLGSFDRAPSSEAPRATLGVLFRLDRQRDGRLVLLVQSNKEPAWHRLPQSMLVRPDGLDEAFDNPAVKEIDGQLAGLRDGQILRFRLRANPTRKVGTKTGPDGKRRNGRRVALTSEADRLSWLNRKGLQHGFELGSISQSGSLPDVIDVSEGRSVGSRQGAPEGKGRLTFGSCVFEGTLRITRVADFKQALVSGIGSGKAFGFGLLSVAPAG